MRIEEWLGKENQLGIDIWKGKYQYEGETFEDWLVRVSNGNKEIAELIRQKRFLFGGRILANRGLDERGRKVTYSNCYVLPQVGDSIEDIYKTCSDLARTFSYGGGVGIDISKLRPKDSFVNNTARKTSGACSFMDTFSQVTETIGQNGRRGALMISIDCTHPELLDFIEIKNDLDRVTKANISVKVTDDFMRAVVEDKDWELYYKSEHEETRKVIKAKEVFRILCKNNWNMAEPGILYWSRIEDYNLLSEDKEFKYDGVNPCAEEPLPAGGSCLLGSINLSSYVDEGQFDLKQFKKDIHVIVKGMNEVLEQGLPLHPLQIQRDTVRDYRQIGIGVMGIADMLIKAGIKYDTDEALEICDHIAFTLANESLKASALLAKEEGVYPKYNKNAILNSKFLRENTTIETYELIKKYGLRNSQILTIAPTGSLSTMLGISGGIEPIFSLSYTRKTESLHGEDVYYKVFTPIADNYMKAHGLTEEEQLPEFFVTAQTLNPLKRVEMQGIWQKHIDASISSTVNLPNSATVEDVEELYIHAWKKGLKGLTIFRDGCARLAVLTLGDKKEEEKEEEEVVIVKEEGLKRGQWKSLAEDTYYLKRNLTIGCGKLKLFIGISPSERNIQDIYITKCGSGGCEKNLQCIAILMSSVLRIGGNLDQIEKSFSGVSACPSFTRERGKGIHLSNGSYCGMAILKEMKAVIKELGFDKEITETKVIETKKQDVKKEENRKKEIIKDDFHCPECGKELIFTGGCKQCECGWSKCE